VADSENFLKLFIEMAPPASRPQHTTTYVHITPHHAAPLPITRRYITKGISAQDPNIISSGLLDLDKQPSGSVGLQVFTFASEEDVVSRPIKAPVQKISIDVSVTSVRTEVAPTVTVRAPTSGKGAKRVREEEAPMKTFPSKKGKFSDDCKECVGAKASLLERNRALESENRELKAKLEMVKAVLKDPAKLDAWTERLRGLKAETVSAG